MKTIYTELAEANKAALLYGNEYKKRLDVLTKLYTEFTAANIEWEISCSCALFLDGIVDNFHDFDILIAPTSYEKAYQILSKLGKDTNAVYHPLFDDAEFAKFEIDGIDVDIICEFGFWTFDSHWQYHFNQDDICYKQIGNLNLPCVPTEIQYIFYAMMVGWQPQRAFKRDLISSYLTNGNLKKTHLLKDAADSGELPPFLIVSIYDILDTEK